MKGKIALALVALAAGVAGCGDVAESEVVATVGAPTMTGPARSPPSDPIQQCGPQGIDSRTLHEGSCSEGTTEYVVVNRDGALRLESLVASVDAVSVESEIGRGSAAVRPREGAFVRFTLTVRNRLEYAQRLKPGQTVLGVDDTTFNEATAAQRVHPDALAQQGESRIEGGATLRGDVIFDVPAEVVERIMRSGRLFVANFGERPGEAPPASGEEQSLREQAARALGAELVSMQVGLVRLFALTASR